MFKHTIELTLPVILQQVVPHGDNCFRADYDAVELREWAEDQFPDATDYEIAVPWSHIACGGIYDFEKETTGLVVVHTNDDHKAVFFKLWWA